MEENSLEFQHMDFYRFSLNLLEFHCVFLLIILIKSAHRFLMLVCQAQDPLNLSTHQTACSFISGDDVKADTLDLDTAI
jgi:hypothetical protein